MNETSNLFIRKGKWPKRIANVDIAHEAAFTINELINSEPQEFKKPGSKTKFSQSQSSDSFIHQAAATVSERKNSNMYKALAYRDPMTGLIRKEGYTVELEKLVEKFTNGETNRVSLIQIDIDLFSWINDVLKCHLFGDLVLEANGEIIRNSIRTADLAFRKGGEEFIIIPDPETDLPITLLLAQRLVQNTKDRLLTQSVNMVVDGHRMREIRVGGEKLRDREGTLALKEFARGVVALKEDGMDFFMTRGKGTNEQKKQLEERLKQLDIVDYKQYIADNRVYTHLNDSEKENRRKFEQGLGRDISKLFKAITCSVGVISLGNLDRDSYKDHIKPLAFDGIVDRLVYEAKENSGDCIAVQNNWAGNSYILRS